MAINDFAAFIQFLAALYLSLGFEGLFNNFFFTPFFKNQMEEYYNLMAEWFDLSEEKRKEFEIAMTNRRQYVYDKARNVALIAFIVCLFLLLLGGIETNYPKTSFVWEKNSWFGDWWWVAIALVVGPALYILWIGIRYRYCQVKKIINTAAELRDQYNEDFSYYIVGEVDKCSQVFKDSMLKAVVSHDGKSVSQLMPFIRETYLERCYRTLKEMI